MTEKAEEGDFIIGPVSADDLALAAYAGLIFVINELVLSRSIDGARLANQLLPLATRATVPPGAQALIKDLADIAKDSHEDMQRALRDLVHGSN